MTRSPGYSLALMAMLVLSGTVAAAEQACPAPSAIKQVVLPNAGPQQDETDYVATENGKTWKGSVSAYDEHKPDLKTLGAGTATTANAKGLVVCDYFNGDLATLRLTPDAPSASAAKLVSPTGM